VISFGEEKLPYDTDERLKSYLDTNQQHREQMCLAILSIDKRFSDVRPRHPRGGPDGGRDIDAIFRDRQIAFGAVGFVNQANDSDEQKERVQNKFEDDLKSTFSGNPKPEVFVFLTNINLTLGEKAGLIAQASAAGFAYCDIMDRERLRVVLDSAEGFSIRFQYLGLPLSEAEQATFFATWGHDLQELASKHFQRVEQTLERVHFLLEASGILSHLTFEFELDRAYSADEIGHFRAYCLMFLKEPKHRIRSICFGSSDKMNRANVSADDLDSALAGIGHGYSGGQWEHYWDVNSEDDAEREELSTNHSDEDEETRYHLVGVSGGLGRDVIERMTISYSRDWFSKLRLNDIDRSQFIFKFNKSFAERIKCIRAYANQYSLQEVSHSEFEIDSSPFEPEIPVNFSDAELSDVWVRVRPVNASAFSMSFSSKTPKRVSS
jgi:hypothetical protein